MVGFEAPRESTMPLRDLLSCRMSGAGLVLLCLLIGGCVTTSPDAPPQAKSGDFENSIPPEFVPVMRYSRYSLVELAPQAAQQDLLLQIVDLSISDPVTATVADALRTVLQLSGYSLCETNPEIAALYSLPLPAAHAHLGPMMLRDALLTLAGSAWDMQVDDGVRQICFVRAGTPHIDDAALPMVVP
jgi:conjugative transfer region protein (TIGR03748 family)